MDASTQIQKLIDSADEIASLEVERLARKVLKKCSDLKEFIMAMGGWHFTLKASEPDEDGWSIEDGEAADDDDPRFSEVERFIGEWDNQLKITGEPMRFTATGPKITDW